MRKKANRETGCQASNSIMMMVVVLVMVVVVVRMLVIEMIKIMLMWSDQGGERAGQPGPLSGGNGHPLRGQDGLRVALTWGLEDYY